MESLTLLDILQRNHDVKFSIEYGCGHFYLGANNGKCEKTKRLCNLLSCKCGDALKTDITNNVIIEALVELGKQVIDMNKMEIA